MIKSVIFAIVVIIIYYFANQSKTNRPHELNDSYDYIIVGGGTAGCVLAARLTEDPSITVLVLEAGGEETDFWFANIPALWPDLQMTKFDWDYLTTPQTHCCGAVHNKQLRWSRGKGLGGCSTHNSMNHVRCNRHDYDHWAYELGNEGWSFQDVLPYLKKLENIEIDHLKDDTELHGFDGPLKINEGVKTPFAQTFLKAIQNAGYTFLNDRNGAKQEGFSWVQFNIDKKGTRMGTANTYLRPAMGRSNLHVVVNAHVTKILFDTTTSIPRATGVEYLHDNDIYETKANNEVIISGGAINSPQILMLSGIGPKEHLKSLNIPVLVDNPAVGSNLDNHIVVYLTLKTNNSEAFIESHELSTVYGYYKHLIRYFLFGTGPFVKITTEISGVIRTGLLPGPWPDLTLYLLNPLSWDDKMTNSKLNDSRSENSNSKEYVFGVSSTLLHPSDKGTIRLRSTNPLEHPIIEPRWLYSSIDADVIVEGLKLWIDLIKNSPELKSWHIRLAEGPLAGCENHVPLSDEYLKCVVRNRPAGGFHPACTCRMGQKGNNSVVDNKLRVHGVQGLRVVDASIFANQLTGNIHAPVVMVAEKAADMIKETYRKTCDK